MNNSGITLTDVREEAFDIIKRLKTGEVDVKTASEVRNLLNSVIDTAKVQVDFVRVLPEHIKNQMSAYEIKSIAGTLKNREIEKNLALLEIGDVRNAKIE